MIREKAVLVCVNLSNQTEEDFTYSLEELKNLPKQ